MIRLDFRSKFVLILSVATLAISGALVSDYPIIGIINLMIPLSFLMSIKMYKKAINGLLIYIFTKLLQIYFLSSVGALQFIISILVYIVLRLIPGYLMYYYAIKSSSISDIIQSMNLMKVPDAIKIPVSVMFRFFYSVREDFTFIREAMYMHELGVSSAFKSPMRYMEYNLVPLLMCSVKSADDVSVSAVTRGLTVGGKRSSISDTHLTILDYLLILFGVIAIVVELWWKIYA